MYVNSKKKGNMQRIYVVMNSDDLTKVNFSDTIENDKDDVRWNVHFTRFIVSFYGECPDFSANRPLYHISHIKKLLQTPDWKQKNV